MVVFRQAYRDHCVRSCTGLMRCYGDACVASQKQTWQVMGRVRRALLVVDGEGVECVGAGCDLM